MTKPLMAFCVVGVAIGGLIAYELFKDGFETNIVAAVRAGDLAAVKRILAREPGLANVKLYPQAYERADQQREYRIRTGEDPWKGRLLIHDVVDAPAQRLPVFDALVAAGARLDARLDGRTLLHEAASAGNFEVANWLIERGADVNATNDCRDRCAEAGWTPLHNAQRFRPAEMVALLAARGAHVDAPAADGRTPLHVAAATGTLLGVFHLCRHGADPSLKDARKLTPHDLARNPVPPPDVTRLAPDDPADLLRWLAPGAGCEEVSARARGEGKPVSEDDARAVYGRRGPRE